MLPTWGQLRRAGFGQSRFLIMGGWAVIFGIVALVDPPNGRLGPACLVLGGIVALVLTLMSIADNEDDAETLPPRRSPQEKALDERWGR